MGALSWIAEHWFDLLQTVGIIGGLLLATYTTRKDEKARRISNLIAITGQHHDIWSELYERPQLARVLEKELDLKKHPVSVEESLFVKLIIVHLAAVHHAMKSGMFEKLEGLRKDVNGFFSAPIPKVAWEKFKPLQDASFVKFIEDSLKHGG
jgi:plasmid maintenance system killer protein